MLSTENEKGKQEMAIVLRQHTQHYNSHMPHLQHSDESKKNYYKYFFKIAFVTKGNIYKSGVSSRLSQGISVWLFIRARSGLACQQRSHLKTIFGDTIRYDTSASIIESIMSLSNYAGSSNSNNHKTS